MARTSPERTPPKTPRSRRAYRNKIRQRRYRERQRSIRGRSELFPMPDSPSRLSFEVTSWSDTRDNPNPGPNQGSIEEGVEQLELQDDQLAPYHTSPQPGPSRPVNLRASTPPRPPPGTDSSDEGNNEVEGIVPIVNQEIPPVQLPDEETPKDAVWFAREITKIKCRGEISDSVMEKITRFFLTNLDDISAIRRRGTISDSYRHTIKKRLDIWQPRFKQAVKYLDMDEPEEEAKYEDNMVTIPARFLHATINHNYQILRTECYTTLGDIKRHYESTHPGLSRDKLKFNYANIAVGIDGVQEANKGARTKGAGKGEGGGVNYIFATNWNKPERTDAEWRDIARKVRDEEPVLNYGITDYTPLLDLEPPVDIVQCLPIDEFHNVKEGLVKYAMTRLLQKNRHSALILRRFNRKYLRTKTFRFMSRRTRSLMNLPDFKGTEYGFLVFSAFPSLIKEGMAEAPRTWRNKKRALAMLCFFTRLYNYDDDIFTRVDNNMDLFNLHKLFYRAFQAGFCTTDGKRVKVPPNVHLFSHLLEVRRRHGPLWMYSTEPFEALYSIVRRSFHAGTRNTPLQIMQNVYLRSSVGHNCRDNFRMHVSADTKGNAKVADNLISTEDGTWWQVDQNLDSNRFLCHKLKTAVFSTRKLGLNLPWEDVGVRRYVRVDKESEATIVCMDNIRGKLIKCGSYLTEWLSPWYRDAKFDY